MEAVWKPAFNTVSATLLP